MNIRLISILILFATVFGLFGCTVSPTATETAPPSNENFIAADQALLTSDTSVELVNLAAIDESGNALFQIVYDAAANSRVEEQCEALAASIGETTGITVPVCDSLTVAAEYEIVVGKLKRDVETANKVEQYKLDDSEFVICFAGKKLIIYAETDYALVSGMIYLTEELAVKNSLEGMYGIPSETEFVYHPYENPIAKASKGGDYYLDFTLVNGPAMNTYGRISYTGNKGWRLQTKHRENEEFKDNGASQILAYSMGEYQLGTEDDRFYKEKITVTQVGNTWIASHPEGGKVHLSTDVFRIDFYTSSGKLAATVNNITQNAGGSSITGVLLENEAIFGTGERFDSVNQRGSKIEMFTKDIWSRTDACYMVIPLLCSSRGSGLFINNYEHMVVDLDSKSPTDHTKKGTWGVNVTGAPLDCYFYTTEQIPEVIRGYSELSGYANMPEEWSYGMIVCARSPEVSKKWSSEITPAADGRGEGVYDMIASMEAQDLPWTGILAEGWSRYDSSTYADLKELCDYVHSLGKKFFVYWRVGLASSKMSGYSSSYLLTQTLSDGTESYNLPDTTKNTNNPDVGENTRTHVYLDVTNPQATAWFFYELWDHLSNEIGVDGCKIDFCETLPENYTLNYFDSNIPTAGSHHWYPTAFCAMFYEMLQNKPDSGMCYTRGGGIGSQRAPYMWAGDQARSWLSLPLQLTAILSSGLSGVPYMSYDMSGYEYNNKESVALREIEVEAPIFLRGTQFTAFTICMQTHGRVRRSYQFANYTDEHGNHPFEYVTDIYRAYTKLHEHLTPYITELSEEASTTGMPVMRHLVLGWQDDANVYGINDEYTFGDAFLIAPIIDDTSSRTVYLPKGIWEDLNTGTVYEVGAEGLEIEVSATLAELPSFFNQETESETARELVDGIKELYDYARTLLPESLPQ